MVSTYYNTLSMFPPQHKSCGAPAVTGSEPTPPQHQSCGAPVVTGSAPNPPLSYAGYHPSYQPYASGAQNQGHNSNLHLYATAAAAQFDIASGGGPPNVGVGGCPHNPEASWSPSFCRSSGGSTYDWEAPGGEGQPGNQSSDLASSETSTGNGFTPTTSPPPPAANFNPAVGVANSALGQHHNYTNWSPTASPEHFGNSSDPISGYKGLEAQVYKQEPICTSTSTPATSDFILPHNNPGGVGNHSTSAGHHTPLHHPSLNQSANLADDCGGPDPTGKGQGLIIRTFLKVL